MTYHPPISERTTDQLLEIIADREQWETAAVEMAQMELTKRGISIEKQETRRKIKNRYLRRIGFIKSNATYSTQEKILIILFGPILVVFLQDILLFQPGEGFKKKNRQGMFYLLLGMGLWGLIIYVSLTFG